MILLINFSFKSSLNFSSYNYFAGSKSLSGPTTINSSNVFQILKTFSEILFRPWMTKLAIVSKLVSFYSFPLYNFTDQTELEAYWFVKSITPPSLISIQNDSSSNSKGSSGLTHFNYFSEDSFLKEGSSSTASLKKRV